MDIRSKSEIHSTEMKSNEIFSRVDLPEEVKAKRGVEKKQKMKEILAGPKEEFFLKDSNDPRIFEYLRAHIRDEELGQRVINFYSNFKDLKILKSLDILINDQRLTEGVMSQLEKLADPSFELADGIDRGKLVAQALRDIASPDSIEQGEKGTCPATSVQIALAIRKPERYLEILRELSSRDGDASRLVKGLRRLPDSSVSDKYDFRTITVKIMTPAFMDYANGLDDYNNEKDESYPQDSFRRPYGGLFQKQTVNLYKGAMGVKADRIVEDAFNEVSAALKKGKTVLAGIRVFKNYSLFAKGDLLNTHALVQKLKDARNPLSLYLRSRFSSETKKLMNSYDGSDVPSEELENALLNEFNEIIKDGSCLYTEERFKGISITDEDCGLISENLKGDELISLNRHLLAFAYHDELDREGEGHEVLLQAISRDHQDQRLYVYFINPWGEKNKMLFRDFKACLRDVTISDGKENLGPAPATVKDLSSYKEMRF